MLGVWHITSHTLIYHWRELPQASFWSRQAYFCRDKHTFVATKAVFCRDKHVFVTTKHVFCCDKSMLVATKVCLSRQKYVYRDKRFVSTSILLTRKTRVSRDRSMLVAKNKTIVATKLCLSRQTLCRDFFFLIYRDKHNFFATNFL